MAASSDSEDESFVELGKPLPFVEGDGKTKPIQLQDASQRSKDAKGRPRFHGAFTGGFSAGYFNSVGSKEGWTPSTFVSSRKQKGELDSRNPEDFMDDEDLGEHGIAPRLFATSGAFSSEAQSRKRAADVLMSTRDSILPASAALTDLIVLERLPIGIKLLRKMGWKEGQGIGPRVKKKKKKKKHKDNKAAEGVRMYGCARPPRSDEEEEEESDLSDIDLENVTFAPKDTTPISLTSKDNVHGLGYRGLDPKSALPGSHISLFQAPAPVRSSKSKKGIRGQAFGVGALEDDDEDIYSTDSLSNYDQTMELDDSDQNFGWTAPKSRRNQGKTDAPQVPVSYVGKLLEGFTLSAQPLPRKTVFPAPKIPKGFQPFHRFKKTAQQLVQESLGEITPQTSGQPQQKLTAVDRGLVLGEKPIASSVFDLIPKADIQRMEAVKDAAKMTTTTTTTPSTNTNSTVTTPPPPPLSATAESKPQHETAKTSTTGGSVSGTSGVGLVRSGSVAQTVAGGSGIKPFHTDPAKQDRYDRFLVLSGQGVTDAYAEVAGSHMTEWEHQREREEFSKAAHIYRPLSSMMASRFTRGTFIDDAPQQKSGLAVLEMEKSDQAKAADMKMYGKLTREEVEWHPHTLLCRRFNIPNPYPESDIVGVPGLKRDKFSIFNFLSVPTQPTTAASHTNNGRQDDPKTSHLSNSLTRELNASKRKKGAMSIFSVLEQEEAAARKPLPPPSSSNIADSANGTEEKSAGDEEENEAKSDDEGDGRPTDLFRAIFKNSDSESSSASEKSDNEKDSDDDDDDDDDETKDAEEKEKTEESSMINSAGSRPPQPISPHHHHQQQQQPASQRQRHQQPSPPPPQSPSTPPGSPPPPSPPPPLATPSHLHRPPRHPYHPPPSSSSSSSSHPPLSSSSSSSHPPPRSRKTSRWNVGSIFDVLEKSPPRTVDGEGDKGGGGGGSVEDRLSAPEPKSSESASGEVDYYGPALPPPSSSSSRGSSTIAVNAVSSFPGDSHRKHKHKHRDKHQERDSSKHKHKKEKKKKSKHKKEKKKKKKSKHSHHKKHSSGSEADSDTDSDS